MTDQDFKGFIPVPGMKAFFLTDIAYWSEHQNELDEWCAKNSCVREGMVVQALDDNGYMLFTLKWA